ncbi:hypothetical protein ES703_60102 [subsurface metagenome]
MTGLAQFKWQLWDEVKNQPAGVGRWIDNGFLDGPRMTIYQYEAILPWLCNLEAGMAMQNLSLAATAIGLGSFMMHTIDLVTVMKALNMRFDETEGKSFPQATPNPVNNILIYSLVVSAIGMNIVVPGRFTMLSKADPIASRGISILPSFNLITFFL